MALSTILAGIMNVGTKGYLRIFKFDIPGNGFLAAGGGFRRLRADGLFETFFICPDLAGNRQQADHGKQQDLCLQAGYGIAALDEQVQLSLQPIISWSVDRPCENI